MSSSQHDIEEFIPVSQIAKQAAMDMWIDYQKEQARLNAWSVRAVKKLVNQSLKSPIRRKLLNINKNTNNAVLPCDFQEETFVGIIDECGQKIALSPNGKLVSMNLVDEIPCENECDKGCDCYPKQLCADLQTTQVINKIRIGDTDYDETVTSTLMPDGEYKVVRTTPYLNLATSGIDYKDSIEYVTSFDVADCGCIEKTARNTCKLENLCYSAYCCYCTGCNMGNTEFGGYKIFKDNNTIQFDPGMPYDKAYIEYRGFLPKEGKEFLFPAIAFETALNLTKFFAVQNKKGVSLSDKNWHWGRYTMELDNMNKANGRVALAAIMNAALLVPKFDYIGNSCYRPCGVARPTTAASSTAAIPSVTVEQPNGGLPSSGCNPAIITTNGSEMDGGKIYRNRDLIGVPFRVFSNTFNRFMFDSELTILSTGGFQALTAPPTGYTVDDEFDIFPKWCDANTTDISQPVTIGARKKAIKVDGIAGSPVAGEYTYQHNDLIGAVVEDILVNKAPETLIDGDFTFDTLTGIITRPYQWVLNDTAIINYIK